jgi:hypothetical protein
MKPLPTPVKRIFIFLLAALFIIFPIFGDALILQLPVDKQYGIGTLLGVTYWFIAVPGLFIYLAVWRFRRWWRS